MHVLKEFPLIALGYDGIDIATEFLPFLNEIPRISEFVKYLVKLFWKKVALFAGIMGVYTIIVFEIVKPLLIDLYF